MAFVVDSSVLVAILMGEGEREVFLRMLLDQEAAISVVTLTEVYAVAQARRGPGALAEVERQITDYGLTVHAVTENDLPILRDALERYGRGRRAPPAVLNFGDLFAYALSRRLGLPLLYKGDDFARTDVRPLDHP